MTYSRPDPSICEWWDVLCKNGEIIRIRYMPKWKQDYPWHSIEFAYPESKIDFIGGKFKPIPMTTEF